MKRFLSIFLVLFLFLSSLGIDIRAVQNSLCAIAQFSDTVIAVADLPARLPPLLSKI